MKVLLDGGLVVWVKDAKNFIVNEHKLIVITSRKRELAIFERSKVVAYYYRQRGYYHRPSGGAGAGSV